MTDSSAVIIDAHVHCTEPTHMLSCTDPMRMLSCKELKNMSCTEPSRMSCTEPTRMLSCTEPTVYNVPFFYCGSGYICRYGGNGKFAATAGTKNLRREIHIEIAHARESYKNTEKINGRRFNGID